MALNDPNIRSKLRRPAIGGAVLRAAGQPFSGDQPPPGMGVAKQPKPAGQNIASTALRASGQPFSGDQPPGTMPSPKTQKPAGQMIAGVTQGASPNWQLDTGPTGPLSDPNKPTTKPQSIQPQVAGQPITQALQQPPGPEPISVDPGPGAQPPAQQIQPQVAPQPTAQTGLPDPATYNYGEEVQKKFQTLWATLPPNMRDPATYQRLQEQARMDAIAPRDSQGRTIHQPGYGTDAIASFGSDPSNQPITQEQQAAFQAQLRPADPVGYQGREGMVAGDSPGTFLSEGWQDAVAQARAQAPSVIAAQGGAPQQIAGTLGGAGGGMTPAGAGVGAIGGGGGGLTSFQQSLVDSGQATPADFAQQGMGLGGPSLSPAGGMAGSFAPTQPTTQPFTATENLRSSQINPQTTSGQTGALDRAFQAANQPMGGSPGSDAARSAVMERLGSLGGPDRTQLALDAFQQYQEASAPAFQQRLTDVGRKAAALGRVGAGMTTSELGDVQMLRERELGRLGRELSTEAAGHQMSDRLAGLQGSLSAAGTLGGLDLGQGQLGLSRAGLMGGLAGQQFQQGLTGREELRGERGYQDQLAQAAQDRRVQQAMMEQQFGQDAFGNQMQQLGLAGQLGLGGNPYGFLQASNQIPQNNPYGTFANLGFSRAGQAPAQAPAQVPQTYPQPNVPIRGPVF